MTEETGQIQAELQQPVQEQEVQTESQEKALTQEQVDKIVADRVARERAKFEKKYSGVDLDHYKGLVEAEEQRKQQELEKRGEYEKLLKDQAEKFNSKIKTYESELHSIKVDGALLQEASKSKAVNPQQVVALLKGSLKLNEAGTVDVMDANGQVRYDDNGNPFPVSKLVEEFLTNNPHFKSAGPQGTGTQGAIGKQSSVNIDVRNLDMTNPDHRKQYAEWRKTQAGY
jgi:hypothetical protein